MYFADLSPYTYAAQSGQPISDAAPRALNVGWLDNAYPFPQAEPSPEFIARLWTFCRTPINAMLGFHECQFCDDDPTTYLSIEQDGVRVGFGHAEIWVFGSEGKTYVAPTL